MTANKRKILITGTGGFIFSNFVRKAIKDGEPYEFVSIDAVKQTSVMNNVYSNKNHQFYIGDITDKHFINVIFELERPDIVINGAASTHVDNSLKNPYEFIDSNITGTQVIIDACIKWNVDKLIQISTDEVYGHLENEDLPSWREDAPLNPRNPYACSKAAAEMLVKAAHNAHGLKYNITRSCNNYGPRQTADKFIPKVIKHILEDKKVPVYGQGKQIRDWVHVQDNCSAIMQIVNQGKDNEIYNIAAGQEFSNIEVFHEICNVLGKGHNLLEFVTDRLAHDFRYSVDASKIKELGWAPSFKFKQGIRHTCEWFSNNQWWYK